MRIALVRGSLRGKGAYHEAFGVSMPPLGLASLAGAVMSQGHEVRLLDASSQGLGVEETAEIIGAWDAQLVAVTMNASPYYEFGGKLAQRVKKKREDVAFVAGGHHATFLYPQILRNGFDYVVLGEGEETFTELVDTLQRKREVQNVKGLALMKDKKAFKTDARPPIRCLDSLPVPAFHLFKKERYESEIFGRGSHIITLETSRGCPYNCDFCSVTAMWGHSLRFKSIKRILKEMKLVNTLGYNWVFIVDDNFIVPANTNERELLFEEMGNRGLNHLNLIVQIRADLAARRPSVIKSAAKAGIRIAFLGLESGSDEVLKAIGKGTCTATATEGVRVLHQNGILTHGGFVIGAPYESKNEVNKTFKYADQLRTVGLDSAQFSIYTPLPGTSAFTRALRTDSLLTLDWDLYDGLHPVLKTRMKPVWLYLNSYLNDNMFFLKKWISGVASRRNNNSVLTSEYSELVQNATRFLSKNLFKYVRGLVSLPIRTVKLWSMLRKPKKPSNDVMKEILNHIINLKMQTRWEQT